MSVMFSLYHKNHYHTVVRRDFSMNRSLFIFFVLFPTEPVVLLRFLTRHEGEDNEDANDENEEEGA